MIKAILKDGVVHPLDPLPQNWSDGQELIIEAIPPPGSSEAISDWMAQVEQAMARIPQSDHERLLSAVTEHRKEQKELMRLRQGST